MYSKICHVFLLVVLVPGHAFYAITIRAAETDWPEQEPPSGQGIYNYYCYQCHGYSGDANTLASSYLNPKPRDFTSVQAQALTRESMLTTVREGNPGTAMVAFKKVLDAREIESVVDYIRHNLMSEEGKSTKYHTASNGWPDHERFAEAFPFATGEISLDTPWEELDTKQRAGKKLYMSACITCHDNRNANSSTPIWEIRAVSYPRKHYSHRAPPPDSLSGASVHELHELPVPSTGLNEQQQQGRELYLENCAFCHAPDGSARNWIGSFLEPRPRDFTADGFIAGLTQHQLEQVIRKGKPGTSMPAWENVLTDDQVSAIAGFLKATFDSGAQ